MPFFLVILPIGFASSTYFPMPAIPWLEAAVQVEAVDLVGADPATDPVGGLEHQDRTAGGDQALRRSQAREPGADHDHIDLLRCHAANLPPDDRRRPPSLARTPPTELG